MKNMKRLFTLILSIVICISAFAMPVEAKSDDVLKFGDDGKFTILNLSDIQDNFPMFQITKDYIKDLIDITNPDLIVLTGDNIGTEMKTKTLVKAAIDEFMGIFEKRGIPVAAVFGNHDDEYKNASKEFQMSVYESYDCFVGYDEGDSLPGCGTYNLPIMSSDGSKIVFNLWMTDSGTYDYDENGDKHYAATKKEQIDWYIEKSNELKAQNGGKVVPSINFQHIIVPEIYDALIKNADGSYSLPENATGVMNEDPCPPNHTNGQFEAFVAQGDVLATVSGHDHTNAFVVPHKGIDIINTPGVGFCSYSNEVVGARVFTLSEDSPNTYETETISYFEVYDSKAALYRFQMYSTSVDGWTKFCAIIKYPCAVILGL